MNLTNWSGTFDEIIRRLEAKGGPYLVCLCPDGLYNRESKVNVEFKRVQCRKCGGWKDEREVRGLGVVEKKAEGGF